MNIHFSPLLATFRALPPSTSTSTSTNDDKKSLSTSKSTKTSQFHQVHSSEQESEFRRMIVDGGLPTWKSSSAALYNPHYIHTNPLPPDASSPLYENVQYKIDNPVAGSLIAKKLEYASIRATYILRRCFADMTSKTKTSDNKGSIEISETSALMKYILLARETFLDETD